MDAKMGKKGKKGKKGKGMIEAGTQKIQPVYFGDDMGKVICTLATGDDVNRIPATVSQNAYVDISALKPPRRTTWGALLDGEDSDVIALAAKGFRVQLHLPIRRHERLQ